MERLVCKSWADSTFIDYIEQSGDQSVAFRWYESIAHKDGRNKNGYA